MTFGFDFSLIVTFDYDIVDGVIVSNLNDLVNVVKGGLMARRHYDSKKFTLFSEMLSDMMFQAISMAEESEDSYLVTTYRDGDFSLPVTLHVNYAPWA